jgi:hypothetical protein
MKKLTLTILAALCLATTASAQQAQFLFSIEGTIQNRRATLRNAKTKELLASAPMARLAQAGYDLEVRHLALDFTAAAIAGGGGREATISAGFPVVTDADHDRTGEPPTVTAEHGMVFVIKRDGTVGNRYEALVDLLGPM